MTEEHNQNEHPAEQLRFNFYATLHVAVSVLIKGLCKKDDHKKYFSIIFWSCVGMIIATLATSEKDPEKCIDEMCSKISTAAKTFVRDETPLKGFEESQPND